MNKKVLSIVLSWILVAVVILIIVNFSLESGEKSTNTSEEVVDSIINSSTNITSEQRETISMLIRKVAHFGIYMLLGFCLFNAFSVTFSRKTI